MSQKSPGSEQWWTSGIAGFLLRGALAVVFTVGFFLQGVHPLLALLPVVLFALYALGSWWTWRSSESTPRR